MKSHNIIYKNNKFYDTVTGRRVFPKDGELFLIAGDNNSFGNHDPLNVAHKSEDVFNSEKKLDEVKKIKNLKSYKRMFQANENIYFDFSITKQKSEGEPKHYRFRIQFLEDLYLYTCTTWKENTLPELHNCRCVVIDDLNRNVDYFEPIHAISLNDAYSKTRQFYFPNQGTPGASVYKKMDNGFQTLEDLRDSLKTTKWEIMDIKNDNKS